MNKYNELKKVKIISTNERGTVVDLYQINNIWYYQIELEDKTYERDVIECREDEIEDAE